MRINQFIAQATGISRRAADEVIAAQQVTVNGDIATPGQTVTEADLIQLDNQQLKLGAPVTIMLNKPVGYVCSRDGQGSPTVYDLLPQHFHHLKPVGRLDKDSSGLLLLTSDGELANQLTHPRYGKTKIYHVTLDKILTDNDRHLLEQGIQLKDGLSRFELTGKNKHWTVTMRQGRNRQIRRTFAALDYDVEQLHRVQFGNTELGELASGKFKEIIVK